MICSPLPDYLGFGPKIIVISIDFGSGINFLMEKTFVIDFRHTGFRYLRRNTVLGITEKNGIDATKHKHRDTSSAALSILMSKV